MPNGYTGTILRVNLSDGEIEQLTPEEDFYRTYMGGGAFGTYFLLKQAVSQLSPLAPENIVTIAPGVTTGAMVSGVSRCGITALSPATNAIGDSQVGGRIGPAIKKAGYDAIVVTGKAKELSYLMVNGDRVEIRSAKHLRGKLILEAYDILRNETDERVSILQCGPAGEKLVRFACLLSDLNDAAGRTGMGAVFGSKNLRAVVVRGAKKIKFADPEGIKELAKLASKRLPNADFPCTLSKYGTPGVISFQAESGNLSTHNYSRSFHEDYKKLDGSVFEAEIGAGKTTCPGCIVKCRRKVKVEQPYQVTDRLGGPEFETLGLLGSNLDITDPKAVAKANELCNNHGIDTITMGGLAGYLFESLENGLINEEATDGKSLGFGNADGLIWLIEQVALRRGIGDVLAEGFEAAVKKFGQETLPFAINVKNHGLAVHMPQVKPSQALTYAVAPIGADHMSSEHDWLLASNSDESKGLGIIGSGEPNSTGLAKVRATVYSQFFYSVLDSLGLCMFCWGPGNLFNYRELEDLLRYTTGWDCTFFELMKAGERKVSMMRQLNAKRGFSREHDCLPEKLSEPIPDGPKKGSRVDPVEFERMLSQYYDLMGWDRKTGNPLEGKLLELGLEWTV
ncbi:MAG: aldehyde ferredoxin oxidoreductase family protein [Proteobacteria bacterium]|nr:aldehyde ferredoxin oxidoreductase family protein [Pseudomonadota bacterium]